MLGRNLIICILLLGVIEAKAQYDPSFSHYFDMEPSFNPAAVGKQAKLNVTAAYALDMAGFEHNPRTLYLAGDMPFYALKTYQGVGVSLLNDQIGLFTHQRLALQYAIRTRMLGGNLGLGVLLGMLNESFEGSKIDVDEPNDPALSTTDVNGSSVDLGLGLYYQRSLWYVGLSAQHLNAPTVRLGETSELKVDATYYLTTGYNIKLRNPFVTIRPSALIKYDDTAWRADLTCRLVYLHENKMMYGGATYSPDHSITFLLGGRFHGVVLGYSYEVYTSKLNPGNGSHELFLGYQTDIRLAKKGKNMHKSVRIL